MRDRAFWVKALALDGDPCPLEIKILIEQYADSVEAVGDAMNAHYPDKTVEMLSNNRSAMRDQLRAAIVSAIGGAHAL